MHTGQVARVVSQAPEILYTVVTPHIPSDVVSLSHHNLGNGRCP